MLSRLVRRKGFTRGPITWAAGSLHGQKPRMREVALLWHYITRTITGWIRLFCFIPVELDVVVECQVLLAHVADLREHVTGRQGRGTAVSNGDIAYGSRRVT